MDDKKTNIALLSDGDEPKTKQLLNEINEAINNSQTWLARMEIAEAVMWTIWDGQSPDGQKHARENSTEEPVPWEGASDTRVRIAASKVLETTAREALALANANLKIIGREGLDDVKATRATALLKWMIDSQMGEDAQAALDLGRFNRAVYGLNIFNVEWQRDEKIVIEEVSFTQFAMANQLPIPQAISGLPEFIKSMQNSDYLLSLTEVERLAYEQTYSLFIGENAKIKDILKQAYPDCSNKRISAIIESWLNGESARVCVRKIISEKPQWNALLPFEDVFFPASTERLNDAPWIAVREWLSEQQVRSMQSIDNWNADFVEAVIKTKGRNSLSDIRNELKSYEHDIPYSLSDIQKKDDPNMCEVFYIYYKAVNDDGIESIYRLVASNLVNSNNDGDLLYGKNEIYECADGQYPFTEQVYWRTDKALLSCIGIPWLLRFSQQNIKSMRDKRLDLVDISTIPPITRDRRDSGEPLRLGPASVVYERVRGGTQWLNPPNSRADLPIEVERAELADCGRLVGSEEIGTPSSTIQFIQQNDTHRYLKSIREVLAKTFRLMQQFLPSTTVMRVTGSINKPFETSAEEIRGAFDLSISYDPSNQNDELKKANIQLIREILGMDTNGIIDHNVVVRYAAYLINPSFAEMAITDASQGQQKIVLEEKQNITLMMTGQSAPLKKEEAGAKIRLQVIMQEIQQNPIVASAYQQNERVKAVFDQRIKNLQMQLMQQQNKTIGALGVNPNIQ
ncbi:MAG: hypothetical protein J6K91_05890 [Opitutales bacterium]|nr:hypothetical protein [Opitutales bacterium]